MVTPTTLRSFRLAPYFRVTVHHRFAPDGRSLLPDEQFFVPAGSTLTYEAPELEKYKFDSLAGLPVGPTDSPPTSHSRATM